MSRPSKYVGVADCRRVTGVLALHDAFIDAGGPALGYQLGIGVMTSPERLRGLPSSWDDAFPEPEEIRSIFIGDPHVFNVVHYADYRDEAPDVEELLERALTFGGTHANGLQLDITWPSPRVTRKVHERHPDLRIILQVGKKALAETNHDPHTIAERLAAYGDSIAYVLPDASEGHGTELDPKALIALFDAIRSRLPNVGLVAAGGVGPQSVERLLGPVMERHRDVSCDAQAKLRPGGNAKTTPVSWPMAIDYVKRTLSMARLNAYTC